MLQTARNRGDSVDEAESFCRAALPQLKAWHDWLDGWRSNPSGLVEIHHGWASGMDNSPRFDPAYDAIEVPVQFDLAQRCDLDLVDESERPSAEEYQRYIWLVRQLAQASFDDAAIREILDFRFGDVFSTAVLALASDDLAAMAVDQAAKWLADVIFQTDAAVVVTYDQNGGYGHPDHIQSHRVTMRAVEMLADAHPQVVRRVFWNAAPAEVVDVELEQLALHQGDIPNLSVEVSRADYDDSVHPMADITCELDVSAEYESKCKALAFHRSQVSVYGQYWVLATGKGMRILDKEWFIEIPGPGRQPPKFRRDLFEGLT